MRAEFEEKIYEIYFAIELDKHTKDVYPSGQCLEFALGFDAAFFVGMWHRWRYPHFFEVWWPSRHRGITLSEEIAEIDETARGLSNVLPPFRLNLFLQYKRPELLSRKNSKEWNCWRQSYFRYGITSHQQRALERVLRASGGRAAVVYVAPAFIEIKELFRNAQSGNLIASSNIVSVNRLTRHSRYTYVSAGSDGVGHSDAEDIGGEDFDQMIAAAGDQDALGFYDHVIQVAGFVEADVDAESEEGDMLEAARRAVFATWGTTESEVEAGTFLYAIGTIRGFLEAFNAGLFMIADGRVNEDGRASNEEENDFE